MGSQKSTVRIPITYVIMIRSLLMICYHQFSCLNLFTEVNKGTSFQRHKLLPKKGIRRISSSQGVRTGWTGANSRQTKQLFCLPFFEVISAFGKMLRGLLRLTKNYALFLFFICNVPSQLYWGLPSLILSNG